MKRFVVLILSLVTSVALLVGPVWAATSGTINVTVTTKLISLSVSPTSYDYGTLDLSDTTETSINFDVENTGNVDEDFDIKGADTTAWPLSGAPGADLYQHDWREVVSGSYAALTTGNVVAATSVGASSSESFMFKLHMPTSSSSNAAQAPNVTFTASES